MEFPGKDHTPHQCPTATPRRHMRRRFIPAFTGRAAPRDLEREMLSLPARLGGLAITNPTMTAEGGHHPSLEMTAILISNIIHQRSDCQPHKHACSSPNHIMPAPEEMVPRERASKSDPTPTPCPPEMKDTTSQ